MLFSFLISFYSVLILCVYLCVWLTLVLTECVYRVRVMQLSDTYDDVVSAYLSQSYFNRICIEIVRDWVSDMPLEHFKAKLTLSISHALAAYALCTRTFSSKWLIRWHFYIRLLVVGLFFPLSLISKQLVRWYLVFVCVALFPRFSCDLFSFRRYLMAIIYALWGVSLLFAH